MSSDVETISNNGNQKLFWCFVALITGAVIWLLSGVLAPFLAGMIIAYFLNPVVQLIQKPGLPRWTATVFVILLFFVVVGWILALLVPQIIQETSTLLAKLPNYWGEIFGKGDQAIQNLKANLPFAIPEWVNLSQIKLADQAANILGSAQGIAKQLFSSGLALFDLVSFLLITPIVTFYCIRDWPDIHETVQGLIPRKHKPMVDELLEGFDKSLGGFVKGQALVSLTLGVFYATALSIAGLNFGLAIGFIAGVLSIIPYVGSVIGFMLSVGVALYQFDGYTMALVAAGIFFFGQIVEGNFLTPKLVGERVGLHPVWVIFALMAGGQLLGFTGLLLAVPVAALIGVFVRFLIKHYRSSHYYS